VVRYRPDIPPHVAEVIRHTPPDIRRAIKAALRAISGDPSLGEPLLRDLEGSWKYRVKRFRIVYAVDRSRRVLRILAVGHRRGVYDEVATLRRRSGPQNRSP
jgi:mRNA interferase RelE/StbE